MPLRTDHAKSSDKQRSQVGPGALPQAQLAAQREGPELLGVRGSIARTGRAVAIVTPPWWHAEAYSPEIP